MSKRLRNKRVRAMLKSLWISEHRMKIFGGIPSPLYRVFDKREYAEDFCAGIIRFMTLESYKNTEDKTRKDIAEGTAKLSISGEAIAIDPKTGKGHLVDGNESFVATTFKDSHFIYCMSLPDNGLPSQKLSKFGKYIVKINDPITFLERVSKAINCDKKLAMNPPVFEASRVQYNKGDHLPFKLSKSKVERIRWTQKPAGYKEEAEYRLHFNVSSLEPIANEDAYFIHVPEGIGDCEIIEFAP